MTSLCRIFNIFLIITALLIPGCGRKIEAGSPEEVLSMLKDKGGTSEVMQLYSDDTVSSMKKYIKLTGMSDESAADVLGFIPSDAEYEVAEKKTDSNISLLKLRFTKHHTENLAGLIVEVRMIKEGNGWKIDRADDLNRLIKSYQNKGAENYLKNIR